MNADSLRIAIVAPPWFPVPPPAYGGIEAVVGLLTDGLVAAGHDVTLFASGDSRTKAKLSAVYRAAPSEWIGNSYHELRHSLQCISRAGDFDLIHDHTGLLGLTLGGSSRRRSSIPCTVPSTASRASSTSSSAAHSRSRG